MSTNSAIEWTDCTWNPVVGCTRVSAGCDHCYAVKQTHRLEAMHQAKYAGLTVVNPRGDRHFNSTVRCVAEALEIPLGWKKPRKVFVNSMSDLFHKDVPFDFIDRVFAVMALCPQHTFQVLTKRPERMAEYSLAINHTGGCTFFEPPAETHYLSDAQLERTRRGFVWPLPNVILGTSCEDQQTANERIPHLLQCPAAVRMLSLEPLLGPIDFQNADGDGLRGGMRGAIHWVIIGGESGPQARPCNVDWIRSIIAQCKAASVPVFVKQLGARPEDHRGGELSRQATINHPKGGDIDEWPVDLRVREFPELAARPKGPMKW